MNHTAYLPGEGFRSIQIRISAINGLLIICRLWLGSFFPLDIEPDNTVLFPNAFDKISALSEFGAKPPNKISWQLSMIILEPSFP